MATTPSPTQNAPMTLTSSQLEQWFANIEKGNGSTTTETDASLAAQFLARYGLYDAAQVIEFLKTFGGNETINMIAKAIMEEEAEIQYIREKSAEELLRQQRLLFLLMSFIEKSKAQAEHVSEQTQQQIDQKLKDVKAEGKKGNSIATNMVDAYARANKIQELDKELRKLEENLLEVEEELEALEEEVLLMEENHAYLTDDLDQLNAYLQVPLFNNQPITHYVAHASQQIATLTTQLATLRAQQAAPIPPTLSDTTEVQRTKERIDRRISMLEERLSFHQTQLLQPPQTSEQLFQQLLERVRVRLNEPEQIHESPTYRARAEVGLRLQERGLSQALQILRNERILLNSQLERVYDFGQAQFIIDPSHMSRYRRYGDSYAYFSEDIAPERQLTEEDWLQAKLNYDESRSNICTVNFFHNDQMKHDVESLRERTHSCQSRAQSLLNRIDHVQTTKLQLLPEKTPFSMTPKPQPKSSYSLMLERLVPSHAPAPRPQDILNARHELEAVVPPERKGALQELINEVRPGVIMPPERRYSWFNKFRMLMPDIPVPEAEEDSKLKYKK
ncbi:hypothetical protein LEAN103870_02260 [Legionella anisa]|uniref:LidA long coiled-coil domain-containing protein n=2 Tax=Legionella anisa TaxID=28082 RepID=A0AAX0WTL1_9GAMM|nr:hypothetical protein [Legionella anisa]AWN74268.1 hypothetical protein DLD14_10660 [Legionella anisa]KTC72056.1 hypothetical protein Lani_1648 [Legionella anisa]MBN5934287.1 hypothetical protein [Legionella anisa]MCW8425697.1 hypothetical protein [Legionella anisa]MCW8448874.1 hypothetical protein [Legionella anisa]